MSRRRKSARAPRQERALATVSSIVEATAQVLVDRGYANTTTNHIAHRAGISIGTLYQYFNDKDEVISALLIEHCAKSERVLLSSLESSMTASLEKVIASTVAAIVDFHFENYDICNVFYNELPREGAYRLLDQHFEACSRTVETFLIARKAEVRVQDIGLASKILVHAIVGAFFGTKWSAKHPEMKREFMMEIQNLARSYLIAT